jgi:hypothetical protein
MKRASLFLSALFFCAATFAADTNKFLAFYRSFKPLKMIESSRSSCLTNGITFKQIVDILGPGWRSPNSGIGLVCWTFKDGREVEIRPPQYSERASTMMPQHFLWHTNRLQTITNGTETVKPIYIKF